MIRFLLKGILRDKSRSILPIAVICIGVMLTVTLSGYLRGIMNDVTNENARFETGHVKVMTRAYAKEKDQLPNDLALLQTTLLVDSLKQTFPNVQWVKRIKFGGLIDALNTQGVSKGQGPAAGIAIDILHDNSGENNRMQISSSLVSGRMPNKNGEAIIGHDFAQKLKLSLGDTVTYFGTTMNGSMTFKNFVICGTIRFGATAMDKGAILVDISDAQRMLDMEDGAGEILGFLDDGVYLDDKANTITQQFNAKYANSKDEFTPKMFTLKQQNNLAELIDYTDTLSGIFVFIFVTAMSVVLWNTGLLGGLRRYKEFGIRLALGESKGNIYRSLILEAILIGFIGSILGTIIGLAATYYLQVHGIDISAYLRNATMLMPSIIRAKVSTDLFYIGFIPGLLAMVIGTMLSGIGIYKRETANLFKELEV